MYLDYSLDQLYLKYDDNIIINYNDPIFSEIICLKINKIRKKSLFYLV